MTTKIHVLVCDERTPVTFSLSPGQAHDAPEGQKLLQELGPQAGTPYLVMDRAYEGEATRQQARELGYEPVVPPKQNRKQPWAYDTETYKRRNEVERFIGRLKRFRKIFTRYDKLDVLYRAFITFAIIVDALRLV